MKGASPRSAQASRNPCSTRRGSPSRTFSEGGVALFRRTAEYYDIIYAFRDYAADAKKDHALIRKHKRAPGNSLLDVACGTGLHLQLLRRQHRVEGLDLDPGMLRIARKRLPGIPLHKADMTNFDLGKQFDAVICLFSSVGYARTVPHLRRTILAMAGHTKPGGVLPVEPWVFPGNWLDGATGALLVEKPTFKIARVNAGRRRGRLSDIDFHYAIATAGSVKHIQEKHTLGLFTMKEYEGAFRRAGLAVRFDKKGLMGRGLYIATKPPL